MEKDLQALDQLIDDAMQTEKALSTKADELALQNKQFADYLAEKKHNDEKLEVLWGLVKDYMIDNDISKHETPYLSLTLTPSGKYRTDDIDSVDDELCDVVKKLNNKKVKAFIELNGKMPDGVESTGFILRKKLKEEE